MTRRKYRVVQFYKTADGKKPVAEWLNTLEDERAQSVAMGVRFFEEYPNPVVPKKFFEKITEHIWEIKVHHGKEQFRLLSFIENDAIIIAVHGMAKKSMDLKQQDLQLAEERRKNYIKRQLQQKKESP
ncbi:MAG TPA: type II toxin-antitoxin system RelE/ParE family toxin [Opitutaceae bacterium]|nr:type II toxin-antitoxin system RelE/ParE family toxin [Opitutaceae bacterium]